MQLECSIAIVTEECKKYYLQRDAPIFIIDSNNKIIGDGMLRGITLAIEPFKHKIGNIEIVGAHPKSLMKKIFYSVSVSDIEKIEVQNSTTYLYVKSIARVLS